MYLILCQPTNFSITHGTCESKIHCDIKFHVITFIQCLPNHICRPYITLFVIRFGLVSMGKWVSCDNLPFYCLLECTSEYLMDTMNSARSKVFSLRFSVFLCNRFCFLQPDIELIHILRSNVLNRHITDCRIDIICNQGAVGLIC